MVDKAKGMVFTNYMESGKNPLQAAGKMDKRNFSDEEILWVLDPQNHRTEFSPTQDADWDAVYVLMEDGRKIQLVGSSDHNPTALKDELSCWEDEAVMRGLVSRITVEIVKEKTTLLSTAWKCRIVKRGKDNIPGLFQLLQEYSCKKEYDGTPFVYFSNSCTVKHKGKEKEAGKADEAALKAAQDFKQRVEGLR